MLILCVIFLTPLVYVSAAESRARYVFLFIGDGMAAAHRDAAELYLAGKREYRGEAPRAAHLAMNTLPVNGLVRTRLLSGIPDSAAAATAIATGRNVRNGVISMNPDTGEKYQSIAAIAQRSGMRIGIVSSIFLQDATAAAFYGHATSRGNRYDLGLQLIESGFEFFGGGGFSRPTGRDGNLRNLYDIAASRGYTIIRGLSVNPSAERVIATHPNTRGGNMPWVIDDSRPPTLADFMDFGIRRLYGPDGFFMLVEGGLIDLAAHANDAATTIHEILALDEAVARALEFKRTRPEYTLIVVMGDHETGGMTFDATNINSVGFYRRLAMRQGSYAQFERRISPSRNANLERYIRMAREFFGPFIYDTDAVRHAFRVSMTPRNNRASVEPNYRRMFATYDPFTMASIKAADAAVGITWTTHFHTGRDVPISAIGQGAELFAGEYGLTEVFGKLLSAMQLRQ